MTAPPTDDGKLIDWAAARDRLARTAAATQRAAKPSRHQTAQILADRARALAEPGPGISPPARKLQLVTFSIDAERFGLEARYVRAVDREPTITPLPSSVDFVVGLTSFRGEIVAVFDIRRLYDSRRERAERSRVLFVGHDAIEFAIVADTVDELVSAPAHDIGRRPWSVDEATSETANGLTPDALNVLDGEALLNEARLIIDQPRADAIDMGPKS
jgi:chemotaxis signal transduction protein